MDKSNSKCGLFLCKCGTNVANFMDLEDIAKWAQSRGDMAYVETHELLCSPAGKNFVEEKLKSQPGIKAVFGACSPKMHEKTFQQAALRAGQNIADIHMANIREQCAWVTQDKDEATAKAKSLLNAAISRSSFHESLQPQSMECSTDVVIIGGGIAGIEAAITAANAGRKVTIVEREISLGGNLIKTEEVAPNMECAPCLLAPRLAEVKENDNITVISNAEVQDVLGFFGNFQVIVKQKPRYVTDTCIGCEECFGVCPVSVKSSFHLGLGDRKAVYTAFPGSVPAAAAIDAQACKRLNGQECDECAKICPFQSINFEDKEQILEITAGAVIAATGVREHRPAAAQLGLGKLDNVYTVAEYDRIASSNGCYQGQIKLKDGSEPKSLAVIHCAGSLQEGELPYCSGICCSLAAKAGEFLRKQVPGAQITNIHDRLVFPSPSMHSFFEKQKKEGTAFVKCTDLKAVAVTQQGASLKVSAPGMQPIIVDMVVLAAGMEPSAGAGPLAQKLNVELTSYGFLKADHAILHETGTSLDGIYTAGASAAPCDAATAITRAQAAAGDAISKLIPGKNIELELMPAFIDENICAGCKLCISVCPYKAITRDAEKNVAVVNASICRGCGTCAATCPSGAATARHFTNQQIQAEIGGVINV